MRRLSTSLVSLPLSQAWPQQWTCSDAARAGGSASARWEAKGSCWEGPGCAAGGQQRRLGVPGDVTTLQDEGCGRQSEGYALWSPPHHPPGSISLPRRVDWLQEAPVPDRRFHDCRGVGKHGSHGKRKRGPDCRRREKPGHASLVSVRTDLSVPGVRAAGAEVTPCPMGRVVGTGVLTGNGGISRHLGLSTLQGSLETARGGGAGRELLGALRVPGALRALF